MRKKFLLLLLVLAEILSGNGFADKEPGTNRVETTQQDDSYFEHLQSDDPNYFVYAHPLGDGALHDDQHAEFYLSIKYAFNLWRNNRIWQPDRLPLIYNGLYDFYVFEGNRYESAPILSRRQNPGIALEWDASAQSVLRLGYFHESNGQSIDGGTDNNANGIDDGAEAFARANEKGGYEYALAQVSRGWEYTNLRYEQPGGREWPWLYHIDLRFFHTRQGGGSMDKEDSIFWESVDGQPTIQDYDGLRIMCELPLYKDRLMTRLNLKTGTSEWEAFENIGGKIALNFALRKNFWLTAFYFNGYGKEPSTYHLRTKYTGIGFEFR